MKVVPSKKFKTLIALYENKFILAKKLGTDESVISRMVSGDRGVSASIIASARQYTGWSYEELFEEVTG